MISHFRVQEIQRMRAIAIIAVVLIHTTMAFTKAELSPVTFLALILDSAAHFAVFLFICIFYYYIFCELLCSMVLEFFVALRPGK